MSFSGKRHYSILKSPIGKIIVEDIDQDFSHPHLMSQSNNKNKPKISAKRALFGTDETLNRKLKYT